MQLHNLCTNYLKEIDDKKKIIEECSTRHNELKDKFVIKKENEKLLAELKHKASQFEEFIKNYSPRFFISEDTPYPDSNFLNESKIANILAMKIKSVEEKFEKQILTFNNDILRSKNELESTHLTLSVRENEVQLLKEAILSERTHMNEILVEKDLQSKEYLQIKNVRLLKYHKKLKISQRHVLRLNKVIEDGRTRFELERKSVAILMKQWAEEKSMQKINEDQLNSRIRELEENITHLVEHWRQKYVSVKKTAASYKVI